MGDADSNATVIQAAYRGYTYRQTARARDENNGQDDYNVRAQQNATVIQSAYRGYATRKRYHEQSANQGRDEEPRGPPPMHNPEQVDYYAVTIQSAYRGYAYRANNRNREEPPPSKAPMLDPEEADRNAVLIQAAYRGHAYRARQPVGGAQEEHHPVEELDQDRHNAAIVIQSSYRGYRYRRDHPMDRRVEPEPSSGGPGADEYATVIQASYRGYRTRREIHANEQATNIQAHAQGRLARQRQEQATVIQSTCQGYIIRKQYADRFEDDETRDRPSSEDAVIIQAAYRGYDTRKRMRMEQEEKERRKQEEEHARVIQEAARAYNESQQGNQDEDDKYARTIQSSIRGHVTRYEYDQEEGATIIQAHAKGYQAREATGGPKRMERNFTEYLEHSSWVARHDSKKSLRKDRTDMSGRSSVNAGMKPAAGSRLGRGNRGMFMLRSVTVGDPAYKSVTGLKTSKEVQVQDTDFSRANTRVRVSATSRKSTGGVSFASSAQDKQSRKFRKSPVPPKEILGWSSASSSSSDSSKENKKKKKPKKDSSDEERKQKRNSSDEERKYKRDSSDEDKKHKKKIDSSDEEKERKKKKKRKDDSSDEERKEQRGSKFASGRHHSNLNIVHEEDEPMIRMRSSSSSSSSSSSEDDKKKKKKKKSPRKEAQKSNAAPYQEQFDGYNFTGGNMPSFPMWFYPPPFYPYPAWGYDPSGAGQGTMAGTTEQKPVQNSNSSSARRATKQQLAGGKDFVKDNKAVKKQVDPGSYRALQEKQRKFRSGEPEEHGAEEKKDNVQDIIQTHATVKDDKQVKVDINLNISGGQLASLLGLDTEARGSPRMYYPPPFMPMMPAGMNQHQPANSARNAQEYNKQREQSPVQLSVRQPVKNSKNSLNPYPVIPPIKQKKPGNDGKKPADNSRAQEVERVDNNRRQQIERVNNNKRQQKQDREPTGASTGYKPHTYEEYKNLDLEVKLPRNLGPPDPEELEERSKALKRRSEYSEKVRKRNENIEQVNHFPKPGENEIFITTHEKRAQYAKTIPKPNAS